MYIWRVGLPNFVSIFLTDRRLVIEFFRRMMGTVMSLKLTCFWRKDFLQMRPLQKVRHCLSLNNLIITEYINPAEGTLNHNINVINNSLDMIVLVRVGLADVPYLIQRCAKKGLPEALSPCLCPEVQPGNGAARGGCRLNPNLEMPCSCSLSRPVIQPLAFTAKQQAAVRNISHLNLPSCRSSRRLFAFPSVVPFYRQPLANVKGLFLFSTLQTNMYF